MTFIKKVKKHMFAEDRYKVFRSICEQSFKSIAIMNLEGEIVYANPRLIEEYEPVADNVIGKDWQSFFFSSARLEKAHGRITPGLFMVILSRR